MKFKFTHDNKILDIEEPVHNGCFECGLTDHIILSKKEFKALLEFVKKENPEWMN